MGSGAAVEGWAATEGSAVAAADSAAGSGEVECKNLLWMSFRYTVRLEVDSEAAPAASVAAAMAASVATAG